MSAGLRLEGLINETLAGTNKKLSEMSGAVLDTIIDDTTRAGRLIQDTLLGLNNGSGGAPLEGAHLIPTSISIEMGPAERLFWVLIFSVMVLVAAGGNTIVVYIVATNREMKSVTNYFLVNLSLADTMVSTLNVIFNFISMLNSHWPFGKVYCKISNFIAILSISASVFTLTAISCDRYNAIIHPLRPRMSHRHAIGWILLIWTVASALALPNFIYSTDLEDRLTNDNVAVTCTMLWPDGRYPLSSYDHIYNIVILVVTYLVPILTMAILYYKVGRELWGYEAIGENIDKQQRAILAKKKIVKMMIVVVIIFALCWLPYHAFFVVNYYVPTIFQDSPLHYQRCYLFMYWLAMSNSMYNPIIIYFMNSNFRREFKKILWLICCCRTYKPPVLRPPSATLAHQNSQQQQQQQRATGSQLTHQTVENSRRLSRPANSSGLASAAAREHSDHTRPESRSARTSSSREEEEEIARHSIGTNGDVARQARLQRSSEEAEQEPFISSSSSSSSSAALASKQKVNSIAESAKKSTNLNSGAPNSRSSSRLIDFSPAGSNNIDAYSSPKELAKVWI